MDWILDDEASYTKADIRIPAWTGGGSVDNSRSYLLSLVHSMPTQYVKLRSLFYCTLKRTVHVNMLHAAMHV